METTFKVGDQVRVTLENDSNHKREGVIKRATLEAHPHQYYLVTFDDSEGEWYQVDLLESTEHDTDTAQAVIEAARRVLKHVTSQMLINPKTLSTRREVGIFLGGVWVTNNFHAGYSDFPDTLLGTLAGLRAAMEAHDAATIDESEDA